MSIQRNTCQEWTCTSCATTRSKVSTPGIPYDTMSAHSFSARSAGVLTLLLATTNPGKLREYRQIFAQLPLHLTTLDEQGIDL